MVSFELETITVLYGPALEGRKPQISIMIADFGVASTNVSPQDAINLGNHLLDLGRKMMMEEKQ